MFGWNAIETVLMEYNSWKTICISSQIGCKWGANFVHQQEYHL